MKTAILLFVSLFTFGNSISQNHKTISGNGSITTQSYTVTDYDSVNSAGIFEVNLISGKEGEITVVSESNLLEYIEIFVEKNQLKIQAKKGYQLKTSKNNKITVTVPVEKISGVSLAGSGSITAQSRLVTETLKVSLAGSGQMNLQTEATTVEASIAGSGELEISGTADYFDLSLAGSGMAKAKALQTKSSELSIAGSGDIEINCSENLRAKIAGSGSIEYYGNPEIKNIKVTGSGRVKNANI